MKRKKPPQVAFCSEHGLLDKVDEDGLCPGCGATCMGDSIDDLVAWARRAREALDKEHNDDCPTWRDGPCECSFAGLLAEAMKLMGDG